MAVENCIPMVLTIHPRRYEQMFEILKYENEKVSIIYDEADQSIGSVFEETDQQKELISRRILTEYPKIKCYYITATAFAVLNSPHRVKNRNIILRNVPTNMYEHKQIYYRGFFHSSNEFYDGECLDYLDDINGITEIHWEQFKSIIERFIDHPRAPHQPNIGLLNVSFMNEPKFDLGERLEQEFKDKIMIVVYDGEGIFVIDDGKYVLDNSHYIGEFIQSIKNKKIEKPILIMAARMANRSQTYRSIDNQWNLTHFMLSLNKNSSMETIIQSLRGNGQYPISAPGLAIYVSKSTLYRIHNAYINKILLSHQLIDREVDYRKMITKTPLFKPLSRIKFSRNEIDDVRFEKVNIYCHGIFNTIEECKKYIRLYSNQYPIVVATTYYNDIPYTILGDETPACSGEQNHLENLTYKKQSVLRNLIAKECIDRNYVQDFHTIQLCYTETRMNQLNQFHIYKKRNFQADIIAINPTNQKTIPVVIYNQKSFNENEAIIWHTTDGRVCFTINNEEERMILRQLILKDEQIQHLLG
jgi:hypothetical protein